MRKLIVATIFVAGVAANAGACPIGSFPSVDNWGNQICKTLDTGQTTTIQGSVENCPVGTHPWVDTWGNKICQSFTGGSQYYDASGGCPIGMYQWVDNWGNKICRSF
jgi:hypothetical protein